MSLSQQERYHFIGIGGIGMSALARILLNENKKVSGSDMVANDLTRDLIDMGAQFHSGHSAASVEGFGPHQTVIYGSSIGPDNPEFVEAKRLGLKILHRSELLWQLAKKQKVLAVAGTHGKTTISSLLSFVLMHAGLDPSFAIGGYIPSLANGRRGKGNLFVLEADESDGSLLNYFPFGAIITNVDSDHMEYFKTEGKLIEVFCQFASQVQSKEHLLFCKDDPHLSGMVPYGMSYGFDNSADCCIKNFVQRDFTISFDLKLPERLFEKIKIPLIGRHNGQNAAAVFALAHRLGIPEDAIRAAFLSFPGVCRRAEKKGEAQGVWLFDDYAHHPTEIKKTLLAFRDAAKERRLIVIFQPHRYTRFAHHFEAFARAFEGADELIVMDIYGANEAPIEGLSVQNWLARLQEVSNLPSTYLPQQQIIPYLVDQLYPHDVVVTFGAGSISALHPPLLKALYERETKKYRVGIVYGGKSCEHEISFRSARFVASSLNRDYYDLIFFGIDKGGDWIVGPLAEQMLNEATEIKAGIGKSVLSKEIGESLSQVDLFFPILHGTFGEDGTIQGFFEMLGKPYAGPDYKSASISMDKVLTKRLLQSASVRTPAFVTFGYREWIRDEEEVISGIEKELKGPWIVKPRHLGSSIGVSKATSPCELKERIAEAFRFDGAVIVEEALENCRELEFPTLGTAEIGIEVASPGEKLAFGQVVDYSMKYSLSPVKTDVAPLLPKEVLEEGKEMVGRAYKSIDATGMARVDCLLDRNNHFWCFEINTIPGMTPLSLFPKVWAKEGIDANALMNRLVMGALCRRRRQLRHIKTL